MEKRKRKVDFLVQDYEKGWKVISRETTKDSPLTLSVSDISIVHRANRILCSDGWNLHLLKDRYDVGETPRKITIDANDREHREQIKLERSVIEAALHWGIVQSTSTTMSTIRSSETFLLECIGRLNTWRKKHHG